MPECTICGSEKEIVPMKWYITMISFKDCKLCIDREPLCRSCARKVWKKHPTETGPKR